MIMYNSETNRLEEVKTEWKPIATEEVEHNKENRMTKSKVEIEQEINRLIEELYLNGRNIGYQSGHRIGYADGVDEAYERGLNDAWECAKKIYGMNRDTRMVSLVFNNYELVFDNYSASEAIEKIKEYEEKKKKRCEFCGDLRNIEPAKYISTDGKHPEIQKWIQARQKEKAFILHDKDNLLSIDKCPKCGHIFTEEDYDSYF